MSTPRTLTWPEHAAADRWRVRGSSRAVLHAGMRECDQWIVMVPGFTGSKEDFLALLEPLAQARVGVVSFDQLGQHQSDGSDVAADYALDELAGDVAQVAATAAHLFGRDDAPHLLGHSFGGLVAQRAVAMGAITPASLIAFCTGPGALPPERHGLLPEVVDLLPHTPLGELWTSRQERDERNGPLPADVQEFLEARWFANHPLQLREFAHHLLVHPGDVDRLADLVAQGLPVSVVWGELDDAWPIDMQQEFARRIGAQAHEIAGAGHSPNADSPAATAELLVRLVRSA